MLIMLERQLMLMMLEGLGPGQRQLMLVMLEGLGLKARAPADVHDARGFGSASPGQRQLMLIMLEGLGLKDRASARASCS